MAFTEESFSGRVLDAGAYVPKGYLLVDSGSVGWRARVGAMGLSMGFEGYGNCCEASGDVVFLELYEGELRLLVWSDVNNEDPTHVISLEGARESIRSEVDYEVDFRRRDP
jgi:hypothetical protein